MEIIVFASTLAIEVALWVYRLFSKRYLTKTRGLVHLCELAVLGLLLVSPIVQWHFRWSGLAILLVLWSVSDLRAMFQQGVAFNYHTGYASGTLLKPLFFIFLAFLPFVLFPPSQPLETTGPYSITSVAYSYIDAGRLDPYANTGKNRTVNVHFWYPEARDAGALYPLVVFSHGGLGLASSNTSLYRELASHGYVVCAIGHPYHAFWTRGEDGRFTFVNMAYFRELQEEDPRRDIKQSVDYYQKWMTVRTDDINFVIDTVLQQSAAGADGVYALIDGAKIGVMGHSLGGSAALAMPRQREDIAAVIALEAPFLYDIVGTNGSDFIFTSAPYPVPVLSLYSDSAWGHLSQWPQYARNAELLADPPENAFNAYLPGAGHFSMTDLALTSPFLVQLLEGGTVETDPGEYLVTINERCLDFFGRFLPAPPYQ